MSCAGKHWSRWKRSYCSRFRRTAGMARSVDEGENERSEQQSENGSMEAGSCRAKSENLPGSRNMDNAERRKTTEEPRGLHISLEEPNLLPVATAHPDVTRIYLDSCGFGPETWKNAVPGVSRQRKNLQPDAAAHFPHGSRNLFSQTYGRPERSWF